MYWFIRNDNDRQITVCFARRNLQNMNPFLAMARTSDLRRILEILQNDQGGNYHTSPGEYLSLSAENGIVTARIEIADALPCRMGVAFFCQLVTDYLAQWDAMQNNV